MAVGLRPLLNFIWYIIFFESIENFFWKSFQMLLKNPKIFSRLELPIMGLLENTFSLALRQAI